MENGSNKAYLGIDWGAADVGVAFADGETKMAFTYTTLANDKKLLQQLAEIIEQKNVGVVVIGIPSHVNREETEYGGDRVKAIDVAHAAKTLGEKIRSVVDGIKIEYQNEMFTTKMAQANLIERGDKHVGSHDDEESARIILQEWLDGAGISQ